MKSIEEIFKLSGALMEGHFKLSSGRHSNKYLQCARVLQYPERARRVCSTLAENFSDLPITGVIAPAVGGLIVAHEVAEALGVRAIFGERVGSVMSLRRGFEIVPSDSLLIVEDVITTGKSTMEIVSLVKSFNGSIAGIGCIADRSTGPLTLPCKPISLLKLKFENWDPKNCPFCASGVPLTTPGSRHRNTHA
jgi:orotate phosphoribosyltransferase